MISKLVYFAGINKVFFFFFEVDNDMVFKYVLKVTRNFFSVSKRGHVVKAIHSFVD